MTQEETRTLYAPISAYSQPSSKRSRKGTALQCKAIAFLVWHRLKNMALYGVLTEYGESIDQSTQGPNLIQVADPGPSLLPAEVVHESSPEPAATVSELEGTALEGTVLEGPSLLQAADLAQRHVSRDIQVGRDADALGVWIHSLSHSNAVHESSPERATVSGQEAGHEKNAEVEGTENGSPS
ncbi:hypothetical protein C8R44DRAFT_850303 [Mycena epipterygia]|nr:hypothetical protein C8R44DRAFT_850303 [Mycena epipterygia]